MPSSVSPHGLCTCCSFYLELFPSRLSHDQLFVITQTSGHMSSLEKTFLTTQTKLGTSLTPPTLYCVSLLLFSFEHFWLMYSIRACKWWPMDHIQSTPVSIHTALLEHSCTSSFVGCVYAATVELSTCARDRMVRRLNSWLTNPSQEVCWTPALVNLYYSFSVFTTRGWVL